MKNYQDLAGYAGAAIMATFAFSMEPILAGCGAFSFDNSICGAEGA